MAAPQIPNLNTLRSGRGGRGRGRALGSSDGPPAVSPEEEEYANDRIVQQTDQDASISRLSAVEVGYLDDPFAEVFASSKGQRRFPIINRGKKGSSATAVSILIPLKAPMCVRKRLTSWSIDFCWPFPHRGSRSYHLALDQIHASFA